MSKIRSQDQLQDALDTELGWRVKEVLTLKLRIRAANSLPQATLIRAGIALLYAHWEGFIKAASLAYAEYVATRGLRFEELRPCFVVLGLRGRLQVLSASKKASASAEALDFIQKRLGRTASFNPETAIDTESNLSSKVFENILNSIGLDESYYAPFYNLIDESLLKRRNKVAHGEYLDLEVKDWAGLADTIVMLLRAFKTDVQNAATLGAYKVAESSVRGTLVEW